MVILTSTVPEIDSMSSWPHQDTVAAGRWIKGNREVNYYDEIVAMKIHRHGFSRRSRSSVILRVTQEVIRQTGFKGLWRGTEPSLIRWLFPNYPWQYNDLFFVFFKSLLKKHTGYCALHDRLNPAARLHGSITLLRNCQKVRGHTITKQKYLRSSSNNHTRQPHSWSNLESRRWIPSQPFLRPQSPIRGWYLMI